MLDPRGCDQTVQTVAHSLSVQSIDGSASQGFSPLMLVCNLTNDAMEIGNVPHVNLPIVELGAKRFFGTCLNDRKVR